MRRDETLREYVRQLTALGVTQKALANAIGKNATWVTRFLKNESGPFTHEMARGFHAHLHKLADLLREIEAYRLRPPNEDNPSAAAIRADSGTKAAKAKRAGPQRRTG